MFAQQGRARGPGARGPYGPWPKWALAHLALYLNQVLFLNQVLDLNQVLYLHQVFIFKPDLAVNSRLELN